MTIEPNPLDPISSLSSPQKSPTDNNEGSGPEFPSPTLPTMELTSLDTLKGRVNPIDFKVKEPPLKESPLAAEFDSLQQFDIPALRETANKQASKKILTLAESISNNVTNRTENEREKIFFSRLLTNNITIEKHLNTLNTHTNTINYLSQDKTFRESLKKALEPFLKSENWAVLKEKYPNLDKIFSQL